MNKKTYKTILILISVCSIISLFVLSLYTRPSSDDYYDSKYMLEVLSIPGFHPIKLLIQAIKMDFYLWRNFDGLFISEIVLLLQPGIYGEKYYFIGAWGIMFFIFLSILLSIKNTLHAFRMSSKNTLFYAIITSAFLLNSMYGITEGIYWFNGAWNYTPFFFLILFNSSILFKSYKLEYFPRKTIILTSLFAFLASGGNYILSLANVLVMMTFSIFGLVKKHKGYLYPFITAFIGLCIEVFSPGAANRADRMGLSGIKETITGSIRVCYECICQWIGFRWIMGMILLIAMLYFLRRKGLKANCNINPIFLLIYTMMIMCAMICAPLMSETKHIAERMYSSIWLAFAFLSSIDIAYLFFWIFNIFNKDNDHHIINNILAPRLEKLDTVVMYISILAMICIAFGNNANGVVAYREISSGHAKLYADTCDERYEMIKNAKPGEIIECSPLPRPIFVYFADITDNLDDWENINWKNYYGVDIRIKADE